MSTGPEPGWYFADGDPPGTHRYWDGEAWLGEPQPVEPGMGAMGGSHHHRSGRLQPGQSLGRVWPRFFARVIDGIIVGIPTIIILLSQVDFEDVGTYDGVGVGWVFLVTLIGAIYEIGFVTALGATPGKLMLGLRVVQQDTNQTPPSVVHAARRWAPALLTLVPGLGNFVGLIIAVACAVMINSDDLNRSVYDQVGGTYVIQK